jgi:hypothetical protein
MTLDEAADLARHADTAGRPVVFTLVGGDGTVRRCRWLDPWLGLFEFAYLGAPAGFVMVDDVRHEGWRVEDQDVCPGPGA